ncbi:hypothetical protein ACZ87_01548 [Candidatus Erwinia dacicola]|uniref:Uncharacterized protein n=1 Tax=Candidatus Erwinia dacicola TaxID=252393 RepID=A0A328TM20_9GAMM|nr:hypothetical protein ACZ87_01548 [Candidatus Erwinia dacicola]
MSRISSASHNVFAKAQPIVKAKQIKSEQHAIGAAVSLFFNDYF